MCDFRGLDRRKKPRRRAKDTFVSVYYRSQRKVHRSLDKVFGKTKQVVNDFGDMRTFF